MVNFNETSSSFSAFDRSNHLQPPIPTDEFFLLEGYDFCWLLLEAIDIANTEEAINELNTRLSPGQKALYCWWFVDGQVTNGGFIQFYYNGYGKYMLTAIDGIRHIGDPEMADLMARAHKIYLKEKALIDEKKTLNEFSDLYDQLENLSELDNLYYEINAKTVKNLESYARQHPDEFCVDENGQAFGQLEGEKVVKYEDGKTKAVLHFQEGMLEGTVALFYPNGNPKAKLSYRKGEKSGVQEYYHKEDGSLRRRDQINPLDGSVLREKFYSSGQLESRSVLDENLERSGAYQEWYENGNLKEEATFIANIKREGKWAKYWPDGSPKMEAEVIEGDTRYTGYWTEAGERLLTNGTGTYINEYVSSFDKDTTIYITEYKNFLRDGVSKSINSGVITLYQEFKAGQSHGWTRSYTRQGELKKEKYYQNGVETNPPKKR